jgi:hypothetical protein
LLGLHGVVLAMQRYEEITPLIDSAVAGGLPLGSALYLIDAMLGAPVIQRAEATDSQWRARYGELYQGISLQTRWLLAAWHAHRRDTVRVKNLRAALLAETPVTPWPLRAALDGHLALARGDSAGAVRSFRELRSNVPAGVLEWGLVDPFAIERWVAASFALARSDFVEAERLASAFDHPSPVMYLPFVPGALALRIRAAEGLKRRELLAQYQERLHRLTVRGRADPVVSTR